MHPIRRSNCAESGYCELIRPEKGLTSNNEAGQRAAVTKLVLNEAKIGAYIQKVGGNAVLEAMKVLLDRRQLCGSAVFFHQPIQGAPSDRIPPITCEQDGRVPAALTQVSFDRLGFIRLQWMLARVAAFQSMNHYAQRFEIEVLDTQQSDLTNRQVKSACG